MSDVFAKKFAIFYFIRKTLLRYLLKILREKAHSNTDSFPIIKNIMFLWRGCEQQTGLNTSTFYVRDVQPDLLLNSKTIQNYAIFSVNYSYSSVYSILNSSNTAVFLPTAYNPSTTPVKPPDTSLDRYLTCPQPIGTSFPASSTKKLY